MGFIFSTTQVPGYSIGLVSHSNYLAMWNWSNNCSWGHDRKSIFRVIFACRRTRYHILRVKLVSDMHRPNKNDQIMSVFPIIFILLNKFRRNHLAYETYACKFDI